jgi:hypothetical protein
MKRNIDAVGAEQKAWAGGKQMQHAGVGLLLSPEPGGYNRDPATLARLFQIPVVTWQIALDRVQAVSFSAPQLLLLMP